MHFHELFVSVGQGAPAALLATAPQSCIDWEKAAWIATCLSALFALFSALFTLGAVWVAYKQLGGLKEQLDTAGSQFSLSMKASFVAKRPDVLTHLTGRFDDIYGALPRLHAADDADWKAFRAVRAFWSLQLEQYQVYLDGFVDDYLYRYWIRLRCQEYGDNLFENQADFQAKTRAALEDFHYEDFQRFMEDYVFVCWDSTRKGVDEAKLTAAMDEAKHRRREHLRQVDPALPKYLGYE